MADTHIKDKKISIGRMEKTHDEDGIEIVTWVPIPGAENIWAYYRHASGSEFYAAATVNSKVEVIFEINWRDDIDTSCIIRYKGKDYNITQIDDFQGYRSSLKITAYEVNGGA